MLTTDELREWVGAGPEDDELLATLEQQAVAEVELATGNFYGAPAQFIDRIIGDGTTQLVLPKYPVTAVASVMQSYLTDVVPAPVAVTDFVIRSPHLVRTGGAVWTRDAEFQATYTAGIAGADVNPMIRRAVFDLVAYSYAAHGVTEEFKSETIGQYSYTRSDSAPTGDAARAAILRRLPRRLRV